ncbi:uncharacterized protein LOC144553211 [Carex rostrata]
MGLREKLLSMLRWEIGNGAICDAVGEPWCEGLVQLAELDYHRTRCKVKDLVREESGVWDMEKLMNLFGLVGSILIATTVPCPEEGKGDDRLIFKLTANGSYSVKKAYANLAGNDCVRDDDQRKFWNWIWKKGNILPRIRLFLWKAVQNALPLSATLASRFNCDSSCATCGEQGENAKHMLFTCPFARGCWFSSPLCLRSDLVWERLQQDYMGMLEQMTEEQWTMFANVAWAILGGKQVSIRDFHKYLGEVNMETKIRISGRFIQKGWTVQVEEFSLEYLCQTDGSWEEPWQGGIGVVLTKREELLLHLSKKVRACSPLQAEAMALIEAIKEVQGLGMQSCLFLSDCKSLVDMVSNFDPPLEADWRAFEEIHQLWLFFRSNASFRCQHRQRNHNKLADYLAKSGRVNNWESSGHTFPLYWDWYG